MTHNRRRDSHPVKNGGPQIPTQTMEPHMIRQYARESKQEILSSS